MGERLKNIEMRAVVCALLIAIAAVMVSAKRPIQVEGEIVASPGRGGGPRFPGRKYFEFELAPFESAYAKVQAEEIGVSLGISLERKVKIKTLGGGFGMFWRHVDSERCENKGGISSLLAHLSDPCSLMCDAHAEEGAAGLYRLAVRTKGSKPVAFSGEVVFLQNE